MTTTSGNFSIDSLVHSAGSAFTHHVRPLSRLNEPPEPPRPGSDDCECGTVTPPIPPSGAVTPSPPCAHSTTAPKCAIDYAVVDSAYNLNIVYCNGSVDCAGYVRGPPGERGERGGTIQSAYLDHEGNLHFVLTDGSMSVVPKFADALQMQPPPTISSIWGDELGHLHVKMTDGSMFVAKDYWSSFPRARETLDIEINSIGDIQAGKKVDVQLVNGRFQERCNTNVPAFSVQRVDGKVDVNVSAGPCIVEAEVFADDPRLRGLIVQIHDHGKNGAVIAAGDMRVKTSVTENCSLTFSVENSNGTTCHVRTCFVSLRN